MKTFLVVLLFAVANGAPGVIYPQHLVFNPWFGTYTQPLTYYYYYPPSRNVPDTVDGRWWKSCTGPTMGSDGNQCCLQGEGDCDSDSDCCVGLYCEQSWGNDYCQPKSVAELPVSTEPPQVNFPTDTPAGFNFDINVIMEWPDEMKQFYLQTLGERIPGYKDALQMDSSLRFDTVVDTIVKQLLTVADLNGDGKLTDEESFKAQSDEEKDSIEKIREDIKRFDTDGDQKLTFEELRTFGRETLKEELKEKFAEMDFNGDRNISPEELAESAYTTGSSTGDVSSIFIVESWVPQSERNTASDWLALDYKEFEAMSISMAILGYDQAEGTNTDLQAQIVGYSHFPSFPAKLNMQAVHNTIKAGWQGVLSNIGSS